MERNKIYLGDCYDLIKRVEDKSIQIIYTDVPYLFKNGGNAGLNPLANRIQARNDYLSDSNIDRGFDYSIFNEFVRIQPKVNLFVWCSKMQIFDIANWWLGWARDNKKEIRYEILTWHKTNPMPSTNNTWLPDTEYCLYFREPGIKLNDGYDHKRKFYVSGLNMADKSDYGHPTCKPLDFVENNLKHICQPGDTVLDPFVGSGTTCLAAKHLGLNYIGFEINEHFYRIACDRLKGFNQKGEMNLFDIEM